LKKIARFKLAREKKTFLIKVAKKKPSFKVKNTHFLFAAVGAKILGKKM